MYVFPFLPSSIFISIYTTLYHITNINDFNIQTRKAAAVAMTKISRNDNNNISDENSNPSSISSNGNANKTVLSSKDKLQSQQMQAKSLRRNPLVDISQQFNGQVCFVFLSWIFKKK